MKLEPKIRISTAFARLYRHALDNVIVSSAADPSRAKYLRCSALPFCPFDLINGLATNHLARFLNFRGVFYTSVGTAVHEAMQTSLMQATIDLIDPKDARKLSKVEAQQLADKENIKLVKKGMHGFIVGDWKCSECGSKKTMCTQPYCCDFPMQYEELSIKYKGVVGHVDTVYYFDGKFSIVDYKTTSLANAEGMRSNPPEGYIEQVMAYAYLLRAQFGLKIDYVMLCFVPRDKPDEPYIWEKKVTKDDLAEMRVKLKRYVKLHRRSLKLKTLDELMELVAEVGPCRNPFCETCKTSSLKGLMKRVFEQHKQKFPLGKLL